MVTVPWPKAIKFFCVPCECFPGLYLFYPSCSLVQAQSYVAVWHFRQFSWQFFQKVKFLHFRVAPLRMYHYLQFCLKV